MKTLGNRRFKRAKRVSDASFSSGVRADFYKLVQLLGDDWEEACTLLVDELTNDSLYAGIVGALTDLSIHGNLAELPLEEYGLEQYLEEGYTPAGRMTLWKDFLHLVGLFGDDWETVCELVLDSLSEYEVGAAIGHILSELDLHGNLSELNLREFGLEKYGPVADSRRVQDGSVEAWELGDAFVDALDGDFALAFGTLVRSMSVQELAGVLNNVISLDDPSAYGLAGSWEDYEFYQLLEDAGLLK